LHADLADLSELDGIPHEVREHLCDPLFITFAYWQVRLYVYVQCKFLFRCQWFYSREHVLYDSLYRIVSQRESDPPRLNLGQVEDGVDQTEETIAALLYAFHDLFDFFWYLAINAVHNEFGIALDAIERGT